MVSTIADAPPTTVSVCSPDGTHVAASTSRGDIQYVRASDGTLERTLYLCDVQALAFSEDSQVLAAVGGGRFHPSKIKLWRVEDGKQLGEIVIASEGVQKLAVSTDGSLVMGTSATVGWMPGSWPTENLGGRAPLPPRFSR